MLSKVIEFMARGDVGSIASVLALGLSVIGFSFTIWSVIRSKRAAEAAREASIAVRTSLARTDIVAECSTAIAILEEVKRLHRVAAWPLLPDRYSALKRSLILIRTANPKLSDSHKTKIQNAVSHLIAFEDMIEKVIATGSEVPDVPRLNKIVSKQVKALAEILGDIRGQIE